MTNEELAIKITAEVSDLKKELNKRKKEVENFSKKSAQLVLTRLNKDCKVVAIGSNKQIDNLYVNKFNNALTTLVESTREKQVINTWCGELTNVVRGPITEFAESIFK